MPKQVLIVDRDPGVGRATSIFLQKVKTMRDANFIYASDGVRAFALCQSQPFDLVVSEINMGGGDRDGDVFCKRIRSDPTIVQPAFLFCASRGAREVELGKPPYHAAFYTKTTYFDAVSTIGKAYELQRALTHILRGGEGVGAASKGEDVSRLPSPTSDCSGVVHVGAMGAGAGAGAGAATHSK